MGGISDRMQEIRRRRHRKKKYAKLKAKAEKASVSDKGLIAQKLRGLSPGAEVLIAAWGLEARS